MSGPGGEPKRRSGGYLVTLALGALGVVYGDIGTSPLYALKEAFVAAESLQVTRQAVLGVLSLMVWSLLIVVSLKYLTIVMRSDNDGEGGILALTALILQGSTTGARRAMLDGLGLFGTALLYGDGMITPAISVLAAVEGVELAMPALGDHVVLIAGAILVALFAVQRRGTAAIGAIFGPVMIVWFGVLAALGLRQIVAAPTILVALSPTYAISFVTAHPRLSFFALGAIFLVVTGSEALYADMGHFGRGPIRLGWFSVVLPALMLNYFGQGALVLADPGAIDSPFYRLAPSWASIPLVGLATLATVIASQALISGAFSLTMQAVQLGYLPRQRIDHTSPREFGQVYIPAVNWTLMVATIGLVVAFGSSSNLAAAYGVAVTTTMVITTVLMAVVMRARWQWGLGRVVVVTFLLMIVDLAFFAANIIKIPDGGWFPLAVGFVVFIVMSTWKRGRAVVAKGIHRGELSIERFIGSIAEHPQERVRGTAVYMFPDPGATPPALLSNLEHHAVLHETIAVVSVQVMRRPRVHAAQRAVLHPLGEGFHQITLRYGFMDQPDVPSALSEIVSRDFGFDPDRATYFLGRETVVPTPHRGLMAWRQRLFAILQRNASSAVGYFGLPPNKVIEVGLQIEL